MRGAVGASRGVSGAGLGFAAGSTQEELSQRVEASIKDAKASGGDRPLAWDGATKAGSELAHQARAPPAAAPRRAGAALCGCQLRRSRAGAPVQRLRICGNYCCGPSWARRAAGGVGSSLAAAACSLRPCISRGG